MASGRRPPIAPRGSVRRECSSPAASRAGLPSGPRGPEVDEGAHVAPALGAALEDRRESGSLAVLGIACAVARLRREPQRVRVAKIVRGLMLEERREILHAGVPEPEPEHERILRPIDELVDGPGLEACKQADLRVARDQRGAVVAGAERPFVIRNRYPPVLLEGARRERRQEAVRQWRLVVRVRWDSLSA